METVQSHFYKSKKFWAAIIAAIVAGAREYGVDVPAELLWVIIAYIMGQGIADAGGYLGKNMPKAQGAQINLPITQPVDTHTQKMEHQPHSPPLVPPFYDTQTWSPDSVSEDIGEANGTTSNRVDLDGLEKAFIQQLEEAGETIRLANGTEIVNPTRLYSKFQARANTYDLRNIPLHERIDEALSWNHKLIQLAKTSFRTFVKMAPPVYISDPRVLLASIRTSKSCGEFVGSYERFHVYELWGLYQQRDGLMNVPTFSWNAKFGNARVTPWQLGQAAKGGLL